MGYGGVDGVVGCDGVGGVVGSGTCCASFLLDTLHLALRSRLAWLFEMGSVRGKTKLDIGFYRLISVFGPGRVSMVGLAEQLCNRSCSNKTHTSDNPPPEFAEDTH